MNLTHAYQAVRAFHIAFGHPVADVPTMQPKDRAAKRGVWIAEEALELKVAPILADQVDAFMDAIYFALGGYVELGVEPSDSLAVYDATPTHPPAMLSAFRAGEFHAWINSEADGLAEAPSLAWQVGRYEEVLRSSLIGFAQLGVDPDPIFDIVHGANMAKLWPDGTVHRREDSKVIKPPGWQDPRPLIEAEVARQLNSRNAGAES